MREIERVREIERERILSILLGSPYEAPSDKCLGSLKYIS